MTGAKRARHRDAPRRARGPGPRALRAFRGAAAAGDARFPGPGRRQQAAGGIAIAAGRAYMGAS